MNATASELLAPEFLSRLERITLRVRRILSGLDPGERRTARRGAGMEFASHRGYVAGDDLRNLDWAALGRFGRAFIKTYEEERDLTVHLLLDTSRSMSFGEPSKMLAAARIAAVLGHIALSSFDRVGAGLFDGDRLHLHSPARGRGALFPLLKFLESARADGPTGISRTLRRHAASATPGLTIVLSDFLDPEGASILDAHRFRRHSLVLIQILSREEIDPRLDGDLRLIDSETSEPVHVTIGPREREAYLSRLDAHQASLRRFGHENSFDFFTISNDMPIEDVIWGHLLRGTFLRRG